MPLSLSLLGVYFGGLFWGGWEQGLLLYPTLTSDSLCSPGWYGTHGIPSVSDPKSVGTGVSHHTGS